MERLRNYFNKVLIGIMSMTLLTVIASCHESEPRVKTPADSTVLIYAVATNSLSGNLISDKNEMLQAAKDIDLNKNNILVFETIYNRTGSGDPSQIRLLKLSKQGETYGWDTIKEYATDVPSLNPTRITEVINEVTLKYNANFYGLVFWSHSTGSQPYNTTSSYDGALYSFGQDLTVADKTFEQINITDLAEAIPSHVFDYIWFDSCYMSNIETICQLRNKCDTFIGYPTEVLEYGLPYQLCLPYMLIGKEGLVKAAELFFDYYANSIATIAVVNMSSFSNFASECSGIFSSGIDVNPFSFIKYTRGSNGPFYDLGDYAKAMKEAQGETLEDEDWNNILDDFVVYKAATPTDFNRNPIDSKRYSGISAHVYSFTDESETEKFYKSLDWFQVF